MEVVCMRRKRGPKSTMLKDRDYDVTPYIIAHMYPKCTRGRRTVRGVLWRWVIVGVVGVRSRWVGGGDPLAI